MTTLAVYRSVLRRTYTTVMAALPDSAYVRVHYLRVHGRLPNLRTPKLFTEKLQWLKLHDRDPRMAICADKLRVRGYVTRTMGANLLIPLLDQAATADCLRFEDYGGRYIVKVNHGSGANVVVIDGQMSIDGRWQPFDRVRAFDVINQSLNKDYFKIGREWEYRDIPRRVVVEPLLDDATSGPLLRDYKVHVFHGRAEFVQVISNRGQGVKESWFDRGWDPVDFSYFSPTRDTIPRPAELDDLLTCAEKLAGSFRYVRIDLYLIAGQVMFGEMTFHPASGFMRFFAPEADAIMGSLLSFPDHV